MGWCGLCSDLQHQGAKGKLGDPPDGGLPPSPTQAVTPGSSYTNKRALAVMRVPDARGPLCSGPLLSSRQPITLPLSTDGPLIKPIHKCVFTIPPHSNPDSVQHENLLGVFKVEGWPAPIPRLKIQVVWSGTWALEFLRAPRNPYPIFI